MRSIFTQTSSDIKSGLLELKQDDSSTRYFDFLPLSLGQLGEFHVKMHLFTLPISSLYESTSSVILRGLDGFVFVADSRADSLVKNIEALDKCKKILLAEGYNVADLPRVIQYNKRDLPDIFPIDILREQLNPSGYPDVEASAINHVGITESLEAIAQQIMDKLAQSKQQAPKGRDHGNSNILPY